MPVTDVIMRNAKPAGKTCKLSDERGLYLEVSPTGNKWWRLKYRFEGKEKRLALGVYPECGTERTLGSAGKQPASSWPMASIQGNIARLRNRARIDDVSNSFEVIAREWFAKYGTTWAASAQRTHHETSGARCLPLDRRRPIRDIHAPEILTVLRRIEARGAGETAHRALNDCGQVFRYAVATGRASPRSVRRSSRRALQGQRSHILPRRPIQRQLPGFCVRWTAMRGRCTVRCAMRLAPLLFVRPGELRTAKWADIDLEEKQWRYIVTKTKTPHIVPLSRQAVEILNELHPLTGKGTYVFPSARANSRPMSDNAILAAMRRAGIDKEEMTGHGFRAVARTILDEVLGVRPDFIEHQLAHAVRDPNGRAYNRTAHLPERRKMMQQWADYLDKLKAGAKVIPIDKGA